MVMNADEFEKKEIQKLTEININEALGSKK